MQLDICVVCHVTTTTDTKKNFKQELFLKYPVRKEQTQNTTIKTTKVLWPLPFIPIYITCNKYSGTRILFPDVFQTQFVK